MKRGCFRVSPLGTDVMGMVAAEGSPLGRCLGVAESSLSLSLSLSTPDLLGKKSSQGALGGVFYHLLAGSRRALGRGVWSFSAGFLSKSIRVRSAERLHVWTP
jgi:hypothetical protein